METVRKILSSFRSLPVLLGVGGLAFLLLACVFIAAILLPGSGNVSDPAAALTVLPGPTSTTYSPTATPTRVPTATAGGPGNLVPGVIGIGATVQISGTAGVGLNIREQPGLNTGIRFVALDSEIFAVQDGPKEVDGFIWWHLVTPLDEARSGWAAAEYLSVVGLEN